jgi:hypothetical protein
VVREREHGLALRVQGTRLSEQQPGAIEVSAHFNCGLRIADRELRIEQAGIGRAVGWGDDT